MAKDTRLQRILALGQALIDARRGISLERYAEQHGYSRSTVYRDADELRDIGFPIRSEGGLHRVPSHFQFFGHRGLDPDELLALFVARSVATRIPGSRFDRALGSLWSKLTTDGSQLTLGPGSESALSVAAFQSIDYEPHRAILDTLDRAITERLVVHLRYRKASTGEVTERDVEPGQLHADARVEGVFLIAWCRHRKAVRVFAAQRILAVATTGEQFPPRAETRSRVALRHAFGVWVGRDPDRVVPVRVRFGRGVAGEISERRFHPSQVSESLEDGSLRVSLQVSDPASLVRWLMQYGAEARVEEPAWLAAEIAERHAAAAGAIPAATQAAPIYRRGAKRGRNRGEGVTNRQVGRPTRAEASAERSPYAKKSQPVGSEPDPRVVSATETQISTSPGKSLKLLCRIILRSAKQSRIAPGSPGAYGLINMNKPTDPAADTIGRFIVDLKPHLERADLQLRSVVLSKGRDLQTVAFNLSRRSNDDADGN